jgi:hypothetical protein
VIDAGAHVRPAADPAGLYARQMDSRRRRVVALVSAALFVIDAVQTRLRRTR